jgi:cytochrome c oxidase cbb3-type subunit 4
MVGGLMTAALIVVFAAIVAWAYSARRQAGFDALARLPLEDEATGDETP